MEKVLIAMSGGVDSSVSAALLKKAGLFCHGVYLKVWSPELEDLMGECPWEEDVAAVMAVGEHLGISVHVWDISKQYFETVVSYFVREYAVGRTPNPDILCNSTMKFGLLLDRALAEGYDGVATGHYARVTGVGNGVSPSQLPPSVAKAACLSCHMPASKALRPACSSVDCARERRSEQYRLLAGIDKEKDQSYFLYRLNQKQLAHALFPIGAYTKKKVRALAHEFGLPNADRKDSQGVCFIGKVPVRAFLKRHLPVKKGILVTVDGRQVGEHDGAHFVTIGQRHGIGATGGGTPYFVVDKDMHTNTVVVADAQAPERAQKTVQVDTVHWVQGTPPPFPLSCTARIRYRQPLAACVVSCPPPLRGGVGGGDDSSLKLTVTFNTPQRAITPGQACVFYNGPTLLGGGVITDFFD